MSEERKQSFEKGRARESVVGKMSATENDFTKRFEATTTERFA